MQAAALSDDLTTAVTDSVVRLSPAHKAMVTCVLFGAEEGSAVHSKSVLHGDPDSDSSLSVSMMTSAVGCIVTAFLCEV